MGFIYFLDFDYLVVPKIMSKVFALLSIPFKYSKLHGNKHNVVKNATHKAPNLEV